ncbi:MAG: peptide ABC transporter permease, partial [Desulfobulbaceae bacterium]|nr:peptide ABC transporter permease [Desulfobulbaceae bacterium]
CSVATLLELARVLKKNPPARSVLLLATSGHDQTLAGMRELIWSLRVKSKPLKKMMEKLKTTRNMTLMMLEVIERAHFLDIGDQTSESLLKDALADRIKTEVDGISRRLIALRMQKQDLRNKDIISNLARQRLLIRRLGWRTRFNDLSMDEEKALKSLIPMARKDHTSILSDVTDQLKMLKSVLKFRSLMEKMEVAAIVSLHLSSHGDGFGAFNKGWLYPLKPKINRVIHYSTIDEVLKQAALKIEKSQGIQSIFQDTLRPNQFKPWQSYFFDRPPLGGEVSALAGYLGLSFVTCNDARPMWGTPYDISNDMNLEYAIKQGALVCDMIAFLVGAPQLHSGDLPANGFATVTGR